MTTTFGEISTTLGETLAFAIGIGETSTTLGGTTLGGTTLGSGETSYPIDTHIPKEEDIEKQKLLKRIIESEKHIQQLLEFWFGKGARFKDNS